MTEKPMSNTESETSPAPRCLRCGRPLANPRAVARGIGPECLRRARADHKADPGAAAFPFDPPTSNIVIYIDKHESIYTNVRVIRAPVRRRNLASRLIRPIFYATRIDRRLYTLRAARSFRETFLADIPPQGTVIRGSDILAWAMEQPKPKYQQMTYPFGNPAKIGKHAGDRNKITDDPATWEPTPPIVGYVKPDETGPDK